MDMEGETVGQLDGDVRRWMKPQPDPVRTPNSKPVATQAIAWAQNNNAEKTVVAVLTFRRDQGVGWYGEEVHSFNGHDPLAHAAQEAADGYIYATQHRLEHDTTEAHDLCRMYLDLLRRLVQLLAQRDRTADPLR